MKPANILDDLKHIIEIQSEGHTTFSPSDSISDLFTDEFDEMSWIGVLLSLEILHHIEIPEDVADDHDQTFENFAGEVSKLQKSDNRYLAAERVKMLQDSFIHLLEDLQNG
jgi:hypothetical protein